MLIETHYFDNDKSDLLTQMFRYRKAYFVDKLKWDLGITKQGQEIDQYDPHKETTYLIDLDSLGKIKGTARMRPLSAEPIMSNDLFGFNLPKDPKGVEVSRLCGRSIVQMFQKGGEWFESSKFEYLVGVYYPEMEKIYEKAGWQPELMDWTEDSKGKVVCLGRWA